MAITKNRLPRLTKEEAETATTKQIEVFETSGQEDNLTANTGQLNMLLSTTLPVDISYEFEAAS